MLLSHVMLMSPSISSPSFHPKPIQPNIDESESKSNAAQPLLKCLRWRMPPKKKKINNWKNENTNEHRFLSFPWTPIASKDSHKLRTQHPKQIRCTIKFTSIFYTKLERFCNSTCKFETNQLISQNKLIEKICIIQFVLRIPFYWLYT